MFKIRGYFSPVRGIPPPLPQFGTGVGRNDMMGTIGSNVFVFPLINGSGDIIVMNVFSGCVVSLPV